MKYLALDSEYDKTPAWEMYYLADGTIKDSRLINWRRVEWEKVVKIEMYIKNKKHVFACAGKSRFLFYLRFRKARKTTILSYDGKNRRTVRKNLWVAGWTDGEKCYLTEIDFDTGNIVKRYTCRLKDIPSHIHTNVQDTVPNIKGMRQPIV